MYTFAVLLKFMPGIDEILKMKFENDKHRFIANLVYTSSWFQNSVNEFLKPHQISLQQLNILRILRGANDWMTMQSIKGLMIDKAPNATRLADKLLAKGLVERKRSETDRRVVYLSITEKGIELSKIIDDDKSNDFMNFMTRLTEEEARTVSDILDKIRG